MKVEIYWNLHKKTWSVRHKGIVIKHSDEVYIEDAKLVVQPAGNAKVRRTKRKNVHAFVRGELSDGFDTSGFVKIKYNPYKYKSFVFDETFEPIYNASKVYLTKQGKCFVKY